MIVISLSDPESLYLTMQRKIQMERQYCCHGIYRFPYIVPS